jgi:Tfp pilus assembly protein PilF
MAIREWTRDGLRLALPQTYKRVIPLVVLLALWLVARYLVLGRVGKQGVGYLENPVATADFLTRFWTAGALYTKALSLFAVPWTLIREYSYAALPPLTGPTVSSVVGWLLLLGTSALALLVARKRSPLLIPMLLWLGGFLLLSHLGPRLPMIFAERVLYLPTGGLILALGFALDAAPSRPVIRYAVFSFWMLACCAYGARSVYRIRDWKDDITLTRASLKDAPDAIKNIQAAVNTLYMNGLMTEEEAERHLERAFRIKEDHESPHLAAAQFYIRTDDPKKARYHIERAREIAPRLNDIWVAECVYAAKYDRDKAVSKCREAVKRAPSNPKPWGYLAVAFDHQGEPKRAAIAFKLAIQGMKAPDFGVYFNFGVFLARHQRYRQAREMLSSILAFDPGNEQAREYLLEIEMILENMRLEKGASI